MSEPIRSLQNAGIKQFQKLLNRRQREKEGCTRLDGARELIRAIEAGVEIQTIYFCPDFCESGQSRQALEMARGRKLPLTEITRSVHEKIAYGDRQEGIHARISWQPLSLAELQPDRPAFLLVLEALEKPGNLGAILRSADGAGIGAVILCDCVVDATHPNAIRASMGSIFQQRVVQTTAGELRPWLKAGKILPVAATPHAEKLYSEQDLTGNIALILGAEHAGLSSHWDAAEVQGVRIPMHGLADSLNVSVSAAILMYEALRQRNLSA